MEWSQLIRFKYRMQAIMTTNTPSTSQVTAASECCATNPANAGSTAAPKLAPPDCRPIIVCTASGANRRGTSCISPG
jgi:hypothetical protein